MVTFSLIAALGTAVLTSLFSGFPGPVPIVLFTVLLLLNCECTAANVFEEDMTSGLFVAVISSGLTVLMCGTIVSSNLIGWLCDLGLLDPDKLHPLIPLSVFALIAAVSLFLRRRARQGKLAVQKVGTSLQKSIDRHTYNPNLLHIKHRMIKEGILTERLPDEEE